MLHSKGEGPTKEISSVIASTRLLALLLILKVQKREIKMFVQAEGDEVHLWVPRELREEARKILVQAGVDVALFQDPLVALVQDH